MFVLWGGLSFRISACEPQMGNSFRFLTIENASLGAFVRGLTLVLSATGLSEAATFGWILTRLDLKSYSESCWGENISPRFPVLLRFFLMASGLLIDFATLSMERVGSVGGVAISNKIPRICSGSVSSGPLIVPILLSMSGLSSLSSGRRNVLGYALHSFLTP